MGTAEINDEVMHAFSYSKYIKNVSGDVEKIFYTTLNNYGFSLDGLYHPEV